MRAGSGGNGPQPASGSCSSAGSGGTSLSPAAFAASRRGSLNTDRIHDFVNPSRAASASIGTPRRLAALNAKFRRNFSRLTAASDASQRCHTAANANNA